MIKVVLAGQPNCGKSTIFNMISGIKQHIANYPGVTVDKKSGWFSYSGYDVEMIDLPGTYSFSSYSLEERVAKDVILFDDPDVIVNVVDASNLKRNLYLTFQLLEIGKPVIVVLNMMDVAKRRGMSIDSKAISEMLKCPVVEASGARGEGKEEILEAITKVYEKRVDYEEFKINYEELEPCIKKLQAIVEPIAKGISPRWLAIKSLEGDKTIFGLLEKECPKIEEISKKTKEEFKKNHGRDTENFLASYRYDSGDLIFSKTIKETKKGQKTFTDIADRFVLNRWLAFPILLLIIFITYQLSIVFGYKLTEYTWPLLAMLKNFIIDITPDADITYVPMLTDLGLWMINSANALLNYIPIFFILFALIAILEDVGYMPRMAFILDRLFRKFGLHGQSTLPLVLGGAFVGGCAVPGVMSTKGIADDRARMATILTVPMMNCLAKIPFYVLLLGAFFHEHMSLMMFYISTVTLFSALIVAKLITSTVLQTRETAPFVMELPPYHLPTFKGVILRACERVWQYIKKVCTIVLAVAIVLFALLQFPGLSKEKEVEFESQTQKMLQDFDTKAKKSSYYDFVDTREKVSALLNYYDGYRSKKMIATTKEAGEKVDKSYMAKNPDFYKFVKPMSDVEAKKINNFLRNLSRDRNKVLREIKNEKVENSLLGMSGRALVPISQYAGFDWKINVAFLSSFAARESAVATLGSLYENNKADDQRAEEAMAQSSGYTPLHAASIIIFILLTPPCIATMIVVKYQTNSYRWMIFATLFPIGLAMFASVTVFSLGEAFNLTGLEAMTYYYIATVLIAIMLALVPQRLINWSGGMAKEVVAKVIKS